MRSHYLRLKSSEFLRNFLTLMTGTGIAALFPVLCTPLITRLYTPEQFGIFALFLTFVSVLSSISCLRYEIAIVLPRHNYQAVQLVVLSFLLACGSAIVLEIFFLIFAEDIARALEKDIAAYLYFVPLAVFFNGLYGLMNYYSNRHKRYKDLSMSKILNSSSSTLTKIGLGYAQFGIWGLVIGQIVGSVVGAFNIWRLSLVSIFLHKKSISWEALKRKFIFYKNYPIYNMPAVLMNTLSTNSGVFLFGIYFDAKDVGLIALASNVLLLPISIIATSYSQIFYQKICLMTTQEQLRQAYKNSFYMLLVIGSIFCAGAFVLPEKIIIQILGSSWEGVGFYIKYTSIFVFFQFISSPLSTLIPRCDKNDLFLVYQIANFLLVSASIIIPSLYHLDIKFVFLTYVAVKSLMYFAYVYLCRFVISYV